MYIQHKDWRKKKEKKKKNFSRESLTLDLQFCQQTWSVHVCFTNSVLAKKWISWLKIRLRKLVGTSGAIKRIISHMILVNPYNMSFKVHTCWVSLVLFAAKVIVRLCVCLLYVSRCLLWGLGYFHIEDSEMVFVLYVFSCDSLGHKTEKRITYKWNSKKSKALYPLWIFLWILNICVSKLQHVKKVLSHWL